MADNITLRDIADAWHACVLLGLTTPAAAIATDSVAALLALCALAHGHTRTASTLTATAAASAAAAVLIH